MALLRNIEAVIYDLDGTIIDTEQLHEDGWIYACELQRVTPTRAMLEAQRGLPGDKAARMMLPPEKQNLVEEVRTTKREYVINHVGDVPILGNFVEAYHLLQQRNLPIGVCTSQDHAFIAKVMEKQPWLSSLRERMVWKGMYTDGKPSAEPLLVTLKIMGNLAPEKVVYIGDAHADYLCAQNAGTGFVYFCRDFQQRIKDIPVTVPTISDHQQLLELI